LPKSGGAIFMPGVPGETRLTGGVPYRRAGQKLIFDFGPESGKLRLCRKRAGADAQRG
jgi:hypothetical protein